MVAHDAIFLERNPSWRRPRRVWVRSPAMVPEDKSPSLCGLTTRPFHFLRGLSRRLVKRHRRRTAENPLIPRRRSQADSDRSRIASRTASSRQVSRRVPGKSPFLWLSGNMGSVVGEFRRALFVKTPGAIVTAADRSSYRLSADDGRGADGRLLGPCGIRCWEAGLVGGSSAGPMSPVFGLTGFSVGFLD